MSDDNNKIDKEKFLKPIMELKNSSRYNSISFDSINTNQFKECQKEISDLNKMISLEPNNWEYIEMRGDYRLKINQHFEAVSDYLTANELGPGDDMNIARCFFARGVIWERANYLEDAWEDYDMAVGFDILDPQYNAHRDRLKVKLNKNDELWD